MVRCGDGSLYTGITVDVERRVKEHQTQTKLCAKYLRGKTPITLAYQESAENRSEASKRELKIKGLKKKDKEVLIAAQVKKHLE